jgi:hypothetical protein
MTTFTRISRATLVAVAALAVAAPVASAKPLTIFKPTVATSESTSYQGTYRPAVDNVQLPPDRGDKVGTLSQATHIHQIPVVKTTTVGQSSFDWMSATIGAGFVLSIGLVGIGAFGLRSRRGMALGV